MLSGSSHSPHNSSGRCDSWVESQCRLNRFFHGLLSGGVLEKELVPEAAEGKPIVRVVEI